MQTINPIIGTLVVSAVLAITSQAQPGVNCASAATTNVVEIVRSAAKSGELAFRLTTPDELKALLGVPKKEHNEKDGDRNILILEYPGVEAAFAHLGETAPYSLVQVTVAGSMLDIGKDKLVTLRGIDDLGKLDTFWGVANVSLAKLDLTEQMPRLSKLPFDSRTVWPPSDKLPKGFAPAKLLEEGKNPGLGVRKLHEQGIDGRGVNLAIIDQPLLREHRDYKDRVVEYHEIDAEGVPVQMHGSPVTSIAVGKTCGTAPGASVHYYAVPMWKWWNEHCKPYAAILEQIIQRNKDLPAIQKVRVISLSLGMFSRWPDHELWASAVNHAAAEGILVVTCDQSYLRLALLKQKPGQDADSPLNYVNQFGFGSKDVLCVPSGNRATASHTGPDDYIYWREGGMSWTVPYLAGLGALAFQLDPKINPEAIPRLWMNTATTTPAGLIVNPPAFIEAVRKRTSALRPTS